MSVTSASYTKGHHLEPDQPRVLVVLPDPALRVHVNPGARLAARRSALTLRLRASAIWINDHLLSLPFATIDNGRDLLTDPYDIAPLRDSSLYPTPEQFPEIRAANIYVVKLDRRY